MAKILLLVIWAGRGGEGGGSMTFARIAHDKAETVKPHGSIFST